MGRARNVIIATGGNLAVPIASLIAQPLLAQALGVVGRGEVAAAVAPLTFASALLTLGIPEALTKFIAGNKYSGRAVYLSFAGLATGGLVATFGISALSGSLSGGSPAVQALLIFASAFVAPSLISLGLRALSAGFHDWRVVATAQGVQAIWLLGGTVILWIRGDLTVLSAVVVLAASQTVGGIVNGVGLLVRKRRMSGTEALKAAEVYRFGGKVWVGAVAGIVLMRLDQVLITPLSSVSELGLYTVAASAAEVILLVNLGIRNVTFSEQSARMDLAAMTFAARLSSTLVLGLALAGAMVAWWVIPLLFGTSFAGALPVYYLLSVAMVIGNPASVPATAISAWGRPVVRSVLVGISAVVNIPLVFLLVPQFGALGAAAAMLVAQAVPIIGISIVLRRDYGVRTSEIVLLRRGDVRRIAAVIRRRK